MNWKFDSDSLLACLILCGISAPLSAGDFSTNDLSPDAVRTHLHIHALSNHNGSEFPASIQWHISQAAELPGDDFVWWTEHCELFREDPGRSTLALGFDNFFTVEGGGQYRLGSTGKVPQMVHSLWNYDVSGNALIAIESGAATLTLHPGGQPSRITLEPRCNRGAIQLNWLTQPISARPVIRLSFRDLRLPVGAHLSVRCYLSHAWRNYPVQPRLDFLLRNEKSPPGKRIAGGEALSVETPVPIAPMVDHIELDLAEAASLFPELSGHSLSRIELVAENGSTDTMVVTLKKIEVVNPLGDFPRFRREIREICRAYETEYDVVQKMGVELRFSGMKDHFCVYAPDSLREEWLAAYPFNECEEVLTDIHARGGVYSLAHALGTNPHSDTDSTSAARRDSIREKMFTRLRENSVFDADFLEVGYWNRGNGLLEDYTLLWDALAVSGLPLVGVGVSDAHGSVWDRSMSPNPWATWVYGPPDAGSILDSLLSGRAYFGDLTRWDGQLDLALDNWRMGDTVPTGAGNHSVTVKLSPDAGDLETRLTIIPLDQKIERTTDIMYTMKSGKVDANQPVPIDLSRPCLIRAEVCRKAPGLPDRIVALSNPIRVVEKQ